MFKSKGATVHVLESESIYCDALVALAESVGLACASYSSGRQFLNQLDQISLPACIVVNVRLPHVSGLEVLRTIRLRGFDAPAIAMGDDVDVEVVVESFRNGASNFLARPFSDQEYLSAVQDELERHRRHLVHLRELDAFLAGLATLTQRQKQILLRMLAGDSNAQMSKSLGISIKTTEAHRAAINRRLNAANFARLVRDATRFGAKDILARQLEQG